MSRVRVLAFTVLSIIFRVPVICLRYFNACNAAHVVYARSLISAFSLIVLCVLMSLPGRSAAENAAQDTVGHFRIATLLCKYADINDEPADTSEIQRLLGAVPGGVGHFWQQASYGKATLDTSVVLGWYTLRGSRASYIDPRTGAPDVDQIVRECAALADPFVDFSVFHTINILTNGVWRGGVGGVGGRLFHALDGKSNFAFAVTGFPDWRNQALLTHEIGHGFGLLHSNNSDQDDDPYDNPWTVMSDINHNAVVHPEFGLLAKHFNAYEKQQLGWLDESDILEIDLDALRVGTSQRIALTSLGSAINPGGFFRSVQVRRGENSDFFFTIEARERAGDYEAALPASGVIIHEVDLRSRRAAWIVDASDPPADRADSPGVVWTPGEVYSGDGFSIEVLTRHDNGYEISLAATGEAVAGNSPPLLQPVAERQDAAVDDLFQLYLHPFDADGFSPDLSSPDLPFGSSFTENAHGVWIFEWTPLLQQAGEHTLTFVVTDAVDENLSTRLSVDVHVSAFEDPQETNELPQVVAAAGTPQPLVGNLPWVTLLCKYRDDPSEPTTVSFVQEMFGDGVGQVNHWFREVSYNRMNINGSLVLGWYTLPGTRADYIKGDSSDDGVDDERLTRECMHAADADVDFSNFFGVNTFFNSGFNPFAVGFGKPREVLLDNAGTMATTAVSSPAWTEHTAVVHEMALGMGLSRANNSDRDATAFDNPWTNMSDGRGHAVEDLRYGFLAKHLNAYEKYSLGWLPATEVTELRLDTVIPGGLQVRLAPMSLPSVSAGTRRAIILHDSRYGRNVFYTVEARDNTGVGYYDDVLPATAVIVHQIDLSREEPAWILHDTSSRLQPATYAATENDVWRVGETIELPGASITVRGRTREGFTLVVETGLDDLVGNTSAQTGVVSPVVLDEAVVAENQANATTGWLPWVTLMCQFADSEPSDFETDFVEQMFGSRTGQMADYWSSVSSDKMTIAGTEAFGWYTLSGSRDDYISDDQISVTMLDECVALADADVDFSSFFGINLFYNGEFNDAASGFGGKRYFGADGVGLMPVAALSSPTWQWQAAVAHEMARAMGLGLTDNADDDENLYDNPWTLMSDSRVYSQSDPLYRFRAKYINAHDMEFMGWLDRSDIYEVDRVHLNNGVQQQIVLQPLNETLSEGARVLKIPDPANQKVYYLEARERSGPYDGGLPGSGILIHEVYNSPQRFSKLYHDARNGSPSDYADSVNDVWTAGENTTLAGVQVAFTGIRSGGVSMVLSSADNIELFPEPEQSTGDEGTSPAGGLLANDTASEQTLIGATGLSSTPVLPDEASGGNDSFGNSGNSGSGGGGSGGVVVWSLLLMFSFLSARMLSARMWLSRSQRINAIPV